MAGDWWRRCAASEANIKNSYFDEGSLSSPELYLWKQGYLLASRFQTF